MSLVCINVTQFFLSRVVFFPAVFSAGQQTCLLVAWTTSTPLDRFAVRLKKWLAKNLHDRKKCWLHLCKLEICTYISLAAMYGLTAITKILVAGWKHASFLCYSIGARWFLRLNVVHATRRVFRPAEKTAVKKKLHDINFFDLHLCKLETYTYISLATIYGLTAITKILVAGWKHASFLCYSMGARWFLRILFRWPKLELPSMSAYSPYLRRLCYGYMLAYSWTTYYRWVSSACA